MPKEYEDKRVDVKNLRFNHFCQSRKIMDALNHYNSTEVDRITWLHVPSMFNAKQKYRGMFETQKSGNKTAVTKMYSYYMYSPSSVMKNTHLFMSGYTLLK